MPINCKGCRHQIGTGVSKCPRCGLNVPLTRPSAAAPQNTAGNYYTPKPSLSQPTAGAQTSTRTMATKGPSARTRVVVPTPSHAKPKTELPYPIEGRAIHVQHHSQQLRGFKGNRIREVMHFDIEVQDHNGNVIAEVPVRMQGAYFDNPILENFTVRINGGAKRRWKEGDVIKSHKVYNLRNKTWCTAHRDYIPVVGLLVFILFAYVIFFLLPPKNNPGSPINQLRHLLRREGLTGHGVRHHLEMGVLFPDANRCIKRPNYTC